MKGNKIAVGLILFLLGTSVLPVSVESTSRFFIPPVSNNWFYVGGSGSGNYTIIQDAIDNASNGDTVFVFNGTYEGYVIINKAIHLIGENKNTTCIIGYFAYTISLVTDGVEMKGFTILNNAFRGEGVRIDSSSNIFTDNIIDIPNDRIRLFGNNNTITGNIIKNTYLYISGDDNNITQNTFINLVYSPLTNGLYGIYFMDCWNNIVSNNSFVNAGLYISLENVCNNYVTRNTVNGKPLIYLYNQSHLLLDDNAGQIILVNCTNITIQNQQLTNTTVGIQIIGSASCVITSNTITNNHYGICMNGWNNTIEYNTITTNCYGVELSGEHNTIIGNFIRNNHNALYLVYSTEYNTLIDNYIANSQNSILLDYGSDFNSITNNSITNSSNAILVSSDINTIAGNTITDTDGPGIWILYSDNITIMNNIITNSHGGGIFCEQSNQNTLINNTIRNTTGDGISLNGNNGIIKNNIIINSTTIGIKLDGHSTTISQNTICFNTNGIYISEQGYNTIYGNIINNQEYSGIFLYSSNNNTITGNSVSENAQGLYASLSNNNTIIKNTLRKNTRQALFENCTNVWNQNYWGRPRILPKLIFGKKTMQDGQIIPFFNIDWRPALKP